MLAVKTASTHPVSHVAFNPNGSTFAVAQPHFGVTICERTSGQPTTTIPLSKVGDFVAVLFCEDGAKIAVSSHKGVHLFDSATGNLVARNGAFLLGCTTLTERDGSLLAGGQRDCRGKWGIGILTDPHVRLLAQPANSHAMIVAMSPCGRWGFGRYPRENPVLIDLATGKVAATVDHNTREDGFALPTVCFAANGERFAICDGDDVRVYDTTGAEPEPDAEPETENAPSLVQREEGLPIAPRPRTRLEVSFTLERPEGIRPHDRWYPPMALTPDARGLLVRRPRNRVQLWDVATRSLIGEWSWRLEWVTCLAVAPDGLTAVAGGRFGRVVMWDLE